MPPNFKKAFSDGLGMRHSCGTCTHCNNIRGKEPVCTKYGVRYKGHACLDKTVCDDYNNVLFQIGFQKSDFYFKNFYQKY